MIDLDELRIESNMNVQLRRLCSVCGSSIGRNSRKVANRFAFVVLDCSCWQTSYQKHLKYKLMWSKRWFKMWSSYNFEEVGCSQASVQSSFLSFLVKTKSWLRYIAILLFLLNHVNHLITWTICTKVERFRSISYPSTCIIHTMLCLKISAHVDKRLNTCTYRW